MKKFLIYIGCISLLLMSACDDYLDKGPMDEFTNDNYWTSEKGLRSYSQEFYLTYFKGYDVEYRVFGGYFSGDSYSDDFLLVSNEGGSRTDRFYFPNTNVDGPNNETIWKNNYEVVRKANIMLGKIPDMDITDEAKEHWTGVGRFFRAMAYSNLVKEYGDVPYFDTATDPADDELIYKNRDSRVTVAEKVLEDFSYAVDHMRPADGTLQINKYVAGAFMSRWMLFHGTWLKYHGTTVGSASTSVDNNIIKKLLDGAVKGAEAVMGSGQFQIGDTYNALFSSESLANNPEIIFYREYVSGVLTNALMSYNAKYDQEQGGTTKSAIDSYLCSDGLPIGQSSQYQGTTDPSIANSFKNRDPRLYDSFADHLRIMNSGLHSATSPTGYACKKFLNEQWLEDGLTYVNNNLSPADAPVIRYAEVLLNYVEARYEVSKIGGTAFAQSDLDKSINEIRKRKLTKWGESPAVVRTMPGVTLSGSNLAVNGVVINDPARDTDVDPILWEIRRERRVELMLEGRRSEDLNRWAKFEYLETGNGGVITDAVLGAWVKRSDYPGISKDVHLYNPEGNVAQEGYIAFYYHTDDPANPDKTTPRHFTKGQLESEKNYLRAVPVSEIIKYKDKGYTLSQNPGWE